MRSPASPMLSQPSSARRLAAWALVDRERPAPRQRRPRRTRSSEATAEFLAPTRSRTAGTTSATSPSPRMPPSYAPAAALRSWRACATSPSARCAAPARSTSPPRCASTPATHADPWPLWGSPWDERTSRENAGALRARNVSAPAPGSFVCRLFSARSPRSRGSAGPVRCRHGHARRHSARGLLHRRCRFLSRRCPRRQR